MASPEYVVCLECETPCYVFEWEDGRLSEVLCQACGNDDPDQFALPEDIEEMSGE
jgi:translation initiation factor 2 beta subunit (eIF-2beta)/eIF-5